MASPSNSPLKGDNVVGLTDKDGNIRLKRYCWQKIKDFCAKAPTYLYDHTIGSCSSSCHSIRCCGERRDYYYDQLSAPKDLRGILKFHFMSPFEKWNYEERRRFPWKLLVQIICIILVTIQLYLFAQTKFYVTDFLNENSQTFSKLFVANPVDTSCQNDPIPSPVAYLYTTEEILDQINFTANAYFDLQNRAVGTYGYQWVDLNPEIDGRHLKLTVTKYANGKIDPTFLSVGVEEQDIDQHYIYEDGSHSFFSDDIVWNKFVEEINLIEEVNVEFNVSSVSFVDGSTDNPKCFQFTILITIMRDYDSGSMPLTLKIKQTSTRACANRSAIYEFDTSFEPNIGVVALDSLVIIFSAISILLSGRSLFNTFLLVCRITRFLIPRMKNFHMKILKPLFSFWHTMVMFSSILAVLGSILKLLLSVNVINNIHVVDGTSIVLGLAVFGQWCGLLRFLSFIDKYNILLRTLKIAAPSVFRFILCTAFLYIAFLLCGWLVMGPYHPKFRTLLLSSECLFSLINGDDMFNTYIMAANSPLLVLIFSKIYLYAFVALFIYVVLSVFISLIEDTYGTLHEEWLERKKKHSSAGQPNDDYVVTSNFLYDLRDDEEDKIKLDLQPLGSVASGNP